MTVTSPHILVSEDDGILTIEISRREKKNSLTADMYRAMSSALGRARDNPHVRVVLIRGQDDLFTAGNDLLDFLNRKAEDASAAIPFLHLIAAFEKPLVAAVAGSAIGIGTTMLLHCDLVYAADNARFQLPFVNLAACPEGASSLLLPRVAGHRRAAELLMLGEPFDAAVAREAHIINHVVPAAGVLEAALGAARKLTHKPPQALAVTKALLKRPVVASVIETIDEEAIHFAELIAAPPAKELFAAFLEKRAPDMVKVLG